MAEIVLFSELLRRAVLTLQVRSKPAENVNFTAIFAKYRQLFDG